MEASDFPVGSGESDLARCGGLAWMGGLMSGLVVMMGGLLEVRETGMGAGGDA